MLKGPAGAQSLWQSLQQNELPKAMCTDGRSTGADRRAETPA